MNVEKVSDHPVEDIFGEELCAEDLYFVLPSGSVVLSHNLGEYMVRCLGAAEKRAQ